MGNSCVRPKYPKDTTPTVLLTFFGSSMWDDWSFLEASRPIGIFDDGESICTEGMKQVNLEGVKFNFMWGSGIGRCATRTYIMSAYHTMNVLVYFVSHHVVTEFLNQLDYAIEEISSQPNLKDVRILAVVTFPEHEVTPPKGPRSVDETIDSKSVEDIDSSKSKNETDGSKSGEEFARSESKMKTDTTMSEGEVEKSKEETDSTKLNNEVEGSQSTEEIEEMNRSVLKEKTGDSKSNNEADETEKKTDGSSKSKEEIVKVVEDAFKICTQHCEVIACKEDKAAAMKEMMTKASHWIDEMNSPAPDTAEGQHKSLSVMARMKKLAKTLPIKALTR